MYRRVADDEVSPDHVSHRSLSHHDPIGIPAGDVVLNEVVRDGDWIGCAGTQQTNAEIPSLRCIAVSDKPVRTEPVAAGAAIESYAAAGRGTIPISHGNVAEKIVTGSPAHQNAGIAISGHRDADHSRVVAVKQKDTRVPKLSNQAGALDGDVGLRRYVDPILDIRRLKRLLAAASAGNRVGLPRHGEAVQLQLHMRRAYDDARDVGDGAGHVVHQLAVLRDGQCTGNGPADVHSAGADGAHKQRTEKCRKPPNLLQTFHLDLLSYRTSLGTGN